MAGPGDIQSAAGETGEQAAPIVHVVDDDADLCSSLVYLFETVGVEALTYPDGATFLEELDPDEPAVIIVDVRMPGISGFRLQETLVEMGCPAPVVFCSAHGDIAMSVRAMQQGAVNFLEKPYDPQQMLDVVQEQLDRVPEIYARRRRRDAVAELLTRLTPREREVFQLVAQGLSSQQIAREIGASVKTVDVHRARVKAKTGAESLGRLMRDVLHYDIEI